MAGQPPNAFTNYEPFTRRPSTVFLLKELFSFTVRSCRSQYIS